MELHQKIKNSNIAIKSKFEYMSKYIFIAIAIFPFYLMSCQKTLVLKTGIGETKQVIIANLTPNNYLMVNISKSKNPDDFTAVDFLSDCKVDLYEDAIFKETLPFVLKDTLSGLGYYTSSFKLQANKTYKIISSHPTLGTAEASEYLPPFPDIVNFALLQHADSLQPRKTGEYIIAFQDSANVSNYYFLSTFYRILRPKINNNGDTTYTHDYITNIPSYTPEIPNPTNYYRLFTTDANFDGQLKSFTVDFPSEYNSIYKEIVLIVELSNTGKNFYDWNTQQIKFGTDNLNSGQLERINLEGNIINGYGHFTASSSKYIYITIK